LVAEDLEIPLDILKKLIVSDIKKENSLASGYVQAKNYREGKSWVLTVINDWSAQEKIAFFLLLPFKKETWDALNASFDDFPFEYWKNTLVNAYSCDSTEEIYFAIDCLIKVDRPLMAIDCLSKILHIDNSVDSSKVVLALLQSIRTTENIERFDIHSFNELVNYIQNDNTVSDDDLVKIEWAYLPVINRGANDSLHPQVLEKKLASEPSFFVKSFNMRIDQNFKKQVKNYLKVK
ncbi:TPA: hypothetical protein ACHJ9K_RS01735, partial [Escherichia coli]